MPIYSERWLGAIFIGTQSNHELCTNDKLNIHNHSYFTNNLFAITHEHYVKLVEKLNALCVLLEQDRKAFQTSINSSASLSSSGLLVFLYHARLPRIDLPKFNGILADWLSFKDLFNSFVIKNLTLSLIEKLQYLKTNLAGSSALLLKNTMLSADHFQKAYL